MNESSTLALHATTHAVRARCLAAFAPAERINAAEWSERYRVLAEGSGPYAGGFRFELTPHLRDVLVDVTDAGVEEIWCQKSAQVGWTDGVINNAIAYLIDQDPCAIFMLFPKDKKAGEFTREKLDPMFKANYRLHTKLRMGAHDPGNTLEFKAFDGGFLKLQGSNKPENVKSTPARVGIVEEPDDCNRNLKGQGDSISLTRERVKNYHNRKLLIGGTPTIKGVSAIGVGMADTDQRRRYVPCHACGAAEPLAWENVQWDKDPAATDPVFGEHLPWTARYVCPHCSERWTDADKARNLQLATWIATAPFRGRRGYYMNELMSVFGGDSSLPKLAEKFLRAHFAKKRNGDPGPMIAFWNGSLGLEWELKSKLPEKEALELRALDYPIGTVPRGALLITIGVDVQHDRLAIKVKGWGRGEETWTIYADEIEGSTIAAPTEGVWADLTKLIQREVLEASGLRLHVSAVSIDSSDGARSDAVYGYVRWANRHLPRHHVMAIKGGREQDKRKSQEVFSAPRTSVDVTRLGKAAKYGLRPYIVGTHRAKQLIYERLALSGSGAGHMHWPKGLRPDYLDQLTSEVEVPKGGGKTEWQVKAGVRNEFLDCEVYALHAARRLRTHQMTENEWLAIEAHLRQADLLHQLQTPPAKPDDATEESGPVRVEHSAEQSPSPSPRPPPKKPPADDSPFGSDGWNSRL